jgi:hypothetical protein
LYFREVNAAMAVCVEDGKRRPHRESRITAFEDVGSRIRAQAKEGRENQPDFARRLVQALNLLSLTRIAGQIALARR